MRSPLLLAILDGVGIAKPHAANAVTSAQAPFLQELFSDTRYPCRPLSAAGRDVGLPDGQMGNSEVGHLNIGSGRIINQELTRIDVAIDDGSFFQNKTLLDAFDAAKQAWGTVHIMGLVSDGGVHSMLAHLEALISMAAQNGIQRVRVHAFLDGRDVAPASGRAYIEQLESFLVKTMSSRLGFDVRIGSVMGRYYAMDRDNRWDRIERAWRTLVLPVEPDVASVLGDQSAAAVVQESYDKGVTDEFIEPVAIGTDGINDGDTIVFFNFRPDRARELTRAFIDPDFENYAFERTCVPQVSYVCMTEYDPLFEESFGAQVAFPKRFPENTLADHLSALGLRQLHIAETEKYAHVTFFFNGGVEAPKEGEQRLLIPSPKVATYDLQPQMSAPEVTNALVEAIEADAADVYIVNYANGDMVGHTGVLSAAIKAIEAVARELRRVVEAICAKGGVALITADHGNSEQMIDKDGNPWTAHTTNDVPFVLVAETRGLAATTKPPLAPLAETSASLASDSARPQSKLDLDREGTARLADIAPTLLDIMELPVPSEFTGRSLLLRR